MSIKQSIHEANEELTGMGVHVSVLRIIDWDEIFENVPNSDEVKQDILKSIGNVSTSVQRLKEILK